MFEHRPAPASKGDAIPFDEPNDVAANKGLDRPSLLQVRHRTLMEQMDVEGRLQAEERQQMQIDADYYDHRQWRSEEAAILQERMQAPLVYNQARQTIDWLIGTEKRSSKDYKVLPRRKEDSADAEAKTKLMKYLDDVNQTRHHRSFAFKQAALSGLGWLEEFVNTDPEEELLKGCSEDWRNILRDSRSRQHDLADCRYLFRRKKLDVDYALALFPDKTEEILGDAYDDASNRGDQEQDAWYLDTNLTSAAELDREMAGLHSERSAYVGTSGEYMDRGRRRTVEVIEAWYRVPATKRFMSGGNFHRAEYDPANPDHVRDVTEGFAQLYSRVSMEMRVMLCTRESPLWDGPSPFKHNRFPLIPVWGYRRGADGQPYGVMRGMRDPQDSFNKKMAKANWILAQNRVVADEGAVDDMEELRAEAARPDGVIVKRKGFDLAFPKMEADFSMAMQMAGMDQMMIRDSGGVTNENLGRDTSAKSGIAIERKQDQGAMTTYELFDNLLIAMKLAGEIRLSLMEQYWTEEKVVRIIGPSGMVEWMPINKVDPATGQTQNDITATRCDFVVDSQDYRATLNQAAMEQLFDLMGKIAPIAPQAVLAILDMMVDNTDIPNKEEIVSRIRKVTGQRDPSREPTPEELQADQAMQAKQAEAEQIQKDMLTSKIAEVRSKARNMDVDTSRKLVEGLLVAFDAANLAVTVPDVVPAADAIAEESGLSSAMGAVPVPDDSQAPALPAAPAQGLPVESAAQPALA